MGQGTKSLRSSPLRGGKNREAGSRSREYSDSLVARSHDQQAYCWRATHDQEQQEDRRMVTLIRRAITTAPTTQWQNCLDESASQFALMCLRYFCSQEIDSLYATEFGSTVQSRKSCRMRYFCHAQLFEITRVKNIKSPLLHQPCQNV